MFQPISIFIGLRYSRSKSHTGFVSFITFFSTVGILLGVASLITVVSVMNGFEGELKKRILGIVPHVIVSDFTENKADKEASTKQNKRWPVLREALLSQPHVLQVTPFLESEALIQSAKGLQGVLVQGIMPKYEQANIINTHMVSGSLEMLSNQSYSLVIGQSLANKLQVTLGDEVRLVLPNKSVFTPMGRIPVQRVFTIAGIFHLGSQVDDAMVYVDSRYGAKLLRRTGDGIDKLRLYLDDAFNAKQVVKSLELKQHDSSQSKTLNPASFSTWDESQGALFSAVKMEKNMMWLMLSLIVAVAAFNIVSALVMVVVEKQAEIGILQTLGLARIDVVKIFITQGMVNGLWGVSLGGVLGVVLALNLNDIMLVIGVHLFGFGMQDLPVKLEFVDVFTIIFSALAMSFLATLYPAYQASTTEPAQVLRNE
ncbi:lipoprotein-releasing ABC transporter permease subunit [Colwellia sp. 12G3]|uniref:lipoprotein-releasing ABC transporter permease subunit n=1 Tax=Colwellia sp. 12G3 TaxID=2058299 RepID=UPI000C32D10E|nr:lipoprotein-releasing ABC transporter permease subunit [Colwellia sp. 12G3]PKI16890.1 lipoprotein-releasing system transmembrane subunit, LolC/LolE family [Colwellia sp. 12G3]